VEADEEEAPESGVERTSGRPRCPKCGYVLTFGFGLAFGGYGHYEVCLNDDCDYFVKTQVNE
jgi:hypothetical protein